MSVVPVTLRDSFFCDKFFQSSWEDFDKIKRDMLKESRDFWEKAEKSRMDMMKNMESSMQQSSNNMSNMSNMGSNMNTMSSSSSTSTSSSDRKSSREENGSSIKDMMNKDMMSLDHDDFFAPWFFPRRWMVPTSVFNGNSANKSSTEENKMTSTSKDLVSADNNSSMKRMLFPSDFFSSMNQDEQVIRTKEDDSKFEVSLDTHEYKPEEVKVNIVGNVISVEAKHEEKSENKFVSRQFSRKYTLPEDCIATSISSNLSSDGILMITAPKKVVKKVEASGPRPVPITMKH